MIALKEDQIHDIPPLYIYNLNMQDPIKIKSYVILVFPAILFNVLSLFYYKIQCANICEKLIVLDVRVNYRINVKISKWISYFK